MIPMISWCARYRSRSKILYTHDPTESAESGHPLFEICTDTRNLDTHKDTYLDTHLLS